MKRIGVIADTHIRKSPFEQVAILSQAWGSVDLILHAGDVLSPAVVQTLETLADTMVVAGNMDGAFIRAQWPRRKTITVQGCQIGLIHGDTVTRRLGREGRPLEMDALQAGLRGYFPQACCIVFGHTHRPYCRQADGVLFFNPGAFRPHLGQASLGLLEVEGGFIQGKIIKL